LFVSDSRFFAEEPVLKQVSWRHLVLAFM